MEYIGTACTECGENITKENNNGDGACLKCQVIEDSFHYCDNSQKP